MFLKLIELPLFKIIVLLAIVPALANSSMLISLKNFYNYSGDSFENNNPHSPDNPSEIL